MKKSRGKKKGARVGKKKQAGKKEKQVLMLFNTLSRKLEVFKPIKKGKAGIYSCGPTVYDYAHIGNLRTYIFSDILKRVLQYNNYEVRHVMNVTDVGHLTSDADEGEDKMEMAVKREGRKAGDIANYYWKIFRNDFRKLNISEPNIWCKATEHIREQIELIKKLDEKGYTYKTSDGIYFNTKKFRGYGKLAKLKIKGLKAGARIKMQEGKINKTDFALWKFSQQAGKRQQEWQSPWGVGFPGWHIECSAMSMRYLGEHFDIHTGGEDHIPVHHTNEIAQSEAATGKRFVNYWLHGAFLTFKGEKVSKSRGGLYTISELESKGFPALAYRYFCLTAHYRSQLLFSWQNLESAGNALKNIIKKTAEIKSNLGMGVVRDGVVHELKQKFKEIINNDLNMPQALAFFWQILNSEIRNSEKYALIIDFDRVFGLNLEKQADEETEKQERAKTEKIPEEILNLAEAREKARKNKNWKQADKLREKIKKAGYSIDDTEQGSKIKKI